MAIKEKISEERRKLIKWFINSNELKTAGDLKLLYTASSEENDYDQLVKLNEKWRPRKVSLDN